MKFEVNNEGVCVAWCGVEAWKGIIQTGGVEYSECVVCHMLSTVAWLRGTSQTRDWKSTFSTFWLFISIILNFYQKIINL